MIRMKLGDFDQNGRRRSVPIEGSNFYIEVDNVIPAVSRIPTCPSSKERDRRHALGHVPH
jgi:NADPH-dependent glutamate synthase beta subunit-like oxidoreductase